MGPFRSSTWISWAKGIFKAGVAAAVAPVGLPSPTWVVLGYVLFCKRAVTERLRRLV